MIAASETLVVRWLNLSHAIAERWYTALTPPTCTWCAVVREGLCWQTGSLHIAPYSLIYEHCGPQQALQCLVVLFRRGRITVEDMQRLGKTINRHSLYGARVWRTTPLPCPSQEMML